MANTIKVGIEFEEVNNSLKTLIDSARTDLSKLGQNTPGLKTMTNQVENLEHSLKTMQGIASKGFINESELGKFTGEWQRVLGYVTSYNRVARDIKPIHIADNATQEISNLVAQLKTVQDASKALARKDDNLNGHIKNLKNQEFSDNAGGTTTVAKILNGAQSIKLDNAQLQSLRNYSDSEFTIKDAIDELNTYLTQYSQAATIATQKTNDLRQALDSANLQKTQAITQAKENQVRSNLLNNPKNTNILSVMAHTQNQFNIDEAIEARVDKIISNMTQSGVNPLRSLQTQISSPNGVFKSNDRDAIVRSLLARYNITDKSIVDTTLYLGQNSAADLNTALQIALSNTNLKDPQAKTLDQAQEKQFVSNLSDFIKTKFQSGRIANPSSTGDVWKSLSLFGFDDGQVQEIINNINGQIQKVYSEIENAVKRQGFSDVKAKMLNNWQGELSNSALALPDSAVATDAAVIAATADAAVKQQDYDASVQKRDAAQDIVTQLTTKIAELENARNQLLQLAKDNESKITSLQNQVNNLKQQLAGKLQLDTNNPGSNVQSAGGADTGDISEDKLKGFSSAFYDIFAQQDKVDQLSRSVENFAQRFIGLNAVVHVIRRGFNRAVNDIKSLDKAMTNIAVVTDMTNKQLWGQISAYMALAQQYGVTTQGVYEVSQLYYQQGLSSSKVNQLTAETLKLARIAGIDYKKAADAMTVAVRAFKMEMSDANVVTDVYSKVASVSASNANELAVAMSKTASSAASVGASFENTTAMLAVMIETTREAPENIGSSMKSIISRYGELKTGMTEDGDASEMDFNKTDTALKSIGISIKTATGQFRDFDDVILELAQKWDTLDKNTQRYIATTMAGNRQQSRFIALVSNYDRLVELEEQAANAEDAGLVQYAKTLDSLETKLNQVSTSFQQFYMSIINGSTIGWFLDQVNGLMKAINSIGTWEGLLNITSIFRGVKTLIQIIVNLIKLEAKNVASVINGEIRNSANIARNEADQTAEHVANRGSSAENKRARNTKWGIGLSLAGGAATTVGTLLQNNSNTMQLGAGLSMAGNAMSGASRLSAFGGPGMAIGAVIGALASLPQLISSFDPRKILEKRIEEDEQATEKANIKRAETSQNASGLSQLIDKYNKARDAQYDSAEAAQAYIDVQNEIAEKYPEYVTAIDEAGNYTVNMENAMTNLTRALHQAADASNDYYTSLVKTAKEKLEKAQSDFFGSLKSGRGLGQQVRSQILTGHKNEYFGSVDYDEFDDSEYKSTYTAKQIADEIWNVLTDQDYEGNRIVKSSQYSQYELENNKIYNAESNNNNNDFQAVIALADEAYEEVLKYYTYLEQASNYDENTTPETVIKTLTETLGLSLSEIVEKINDDNSIVGQLIKQTFSQTGIGTIGLFDIDNKGRYSVNSTYSDYLSAQNTLEKTPRQAAASAVYSSRLISNSDSSIQGLDKEFSVNGLLTQMVMNATSTAEDQVEAIKERYSNGASEYIALEQAVQELYTQLFDNGIIASIEDFNAKVANTSLFNFENISEINEIDDDASKGLVDLWWEQNSASLIRAYNILKDKAITADADNATELIIGAFEEYGNLTTQTLVKWADDVVTVNNQVEKLSGKYGYTGASKRAKLMEGFGDFASKVNESSLSSTDRTELIEAYEQFLADGTSNSYIRLIKILQRTGKSLKDFDVENAEAADLKGMVFENLNTLYDTIYGQVNKDLEDFETIIKNQKNGWSLDDASAFAKKYGKTMSDLFEVKDGELVLKDLAEAKGLVTSSYSEITTLIDGLKKVFSIDEFNKISTAEGESYLGEGNSEELRGLLDSFENIDEPTKQYILEAAKTATGWDELIANLSNMTANERLIQELEEAKQEEYEKQQNELITDLTVSNRTKKYSVNTALKNLGGSFTWDNIGAVFKAAGLELNDEIAGQIENAVKFDNFGNAISIIDNQQLKEALQNALGKENGEIVFEQMARSFADNINSGIASYLSKSTLSSSEITSIWTTYFGDMTFDSFIREYALNLINGSYDMTAELFNALTKKTQGSFEQVAASFVSEAISHGNDIISKAENAITKNGSGFSYSEAAELASEMGKNVLEIFEYDEEIKGYVFQSKENLNAYIDSLKRDVPSQQDLKNSIDEISARGSDYSSLDPRIATILTEAQSKGINIIDEWNEYIWPQIEAIFNAEEAANEWIESMRSEWEARSAKTSNASKLKNYKQQKGYSAMSDASSLVSGGVLTLDSLEGFLSGQGFNINNFDSLLKELEIKTDEAGNIIFDTIDGYRQGLTRVLLKSDKFRGADGKLNDAGEKALNKLVDAYIASARSKLDSVTNGMTAVLSNSVSDSDIDSIQSNFFSDVSEEEFYEKYVETLVDGTRRFNGDFLEAYKAQVRKVYLQQGGADDDFETYWLNLQAQTEDALRESAVSAATSISVNGNSVQQIRTFLTAFGYDINTALGNTAKQQYDNAIEILKEVKDTSKDEYLRKAAEEALDSMLVSTIDSYTSTINGLASKQVSGFSLSDAKELLGQLDINFSEFNTYFKFDSSVNGWVLNDFKGSVEGLSQALINYYVENGANLKDAEALVNAQLDKVRGSEAFEKYKKQFEPANAMKAFAESPSLDNLNSMLAAQGINWNNSYAEIIKQFGTSVDSMGNIQIVNPEEFFSMMVNIFGLTEEVAQQMYQEYIGNTYSSYEQMMTQTTLTAENLGTLWNTRDWGEMTYEEFYKHFDRVGINQFVPKEGFWSDFLDGFDSGIRDAMQQHTDVILASQKSAAFSSILGGIDQKDYTENALAWGDKSADVLFSSYDDKIYFTDDYLRKQYASLNNEQQASVRQYYSDLVGKLNVGQKLVGQGEIDRAAAALIQLGVENDELSNYIDDGIITIEELSHVLVPHEEGDTIDPDAMLNAIEMYGIALEDFFESNVETPAQVLKDLGLTLENLTASQYDAYMDAEKAMIDNLAALRDGTASMSQASAIKKQFQLNDSAFSESADGIRLAEAEIWDILARMRDIDKQGYIQWRQSILQDKDGLLKEYHSIAAIQAGINKLESESAKLTREDANAAKEKLSILRQMKVETSLQANPDAFDITNSDSLPGNAKNWQSWATSFRTMGTDIQDGKVALDDYWGFMELVQQYGELVGVTGLNIENANEAFADAWMTGSEVSLDAIGMTSDQAKKVIDEALHTQAQEQIDILDAEIAQLEAMKALSELDGLDVNGFTYDKNGGDIGEQFVAFIQSQFPDIDLSALNDVRVRYNGKLYKMSELDSLKGALEEDGFTDAGEKIRDMLVEAIPQMAEMAASGNFSAEQDYVIDTKIQDGKMEVQFGGENGISIPVVEDIERNISTNVEKIDSQLMTMTSILLDIAGKDVDNFEVGSKSVDIKEDKDGNKTYRLNGTEYTYSNIASAYQGALDLQTAEKYYNKADQLWRELGFADKNQMQLAFGATSFTDSWEAFEAINDWRNKSITAPKTPPENDDSNKTGDKKAENNTGTQTPVSGDTATQQTENVDDGSAAKIATLEAQLADMTALVEIGQAGVRTIEGYRQADKAAWETEKQGLTTKLQAAEEAQANLAQQVDSLQSQIAEKEAQIENLTAMHEADAVLLASKKDELSVLQDSLTTTEAQLKMAQDLAANLSNKITSKDATIADLTSENAGKDGTIAQLTADNEAYSAKNRELVSDLQSAEGTIEALTSEIEVMKQVNSDLADSVNKTEGREAGISDVASAITQALTSPDATYAETGKRNQVLVSAFDEYFTDWDTAIAAAGDDTEAAATATETLLTALGGLSLTTDEAVSDMNELASVVSKFLNQNYNIKVSFSYSVSEDGSVVVSKTQNNGETSGQGLAEGNAPKTLVGELGPELAVYDGQYHLLGERGAEFVNLPKNAIVFNHLQTKKLLNGKEGVRGTALAQGNVPSTGPAKAGIDETIAQLKAIRSLWTGMLDKTASDFANGGGGGGDNSIKAHVEELQEWYNLTRRIAIAEQRINNIVAARKNITDGHEYLNSLRSQSEVLQEQLLYQKQLYDYQKDQLKLQADFINGNEDTEKLAGNGFWSKFFRVDETTGMLQYLTGNEDTESGTGNTKNQLGGRGTAEYLQWLNGLSGKEQEAALNELGYTYTDNDGKQLKGEELVSMFYEEFQAQIDKYDELYDEVQKSGQTMEQLESDLTDINNEIRDNRKDLEQQIYDLIVDASQKEIDELKDQTEAIKDANEAYTNGLTDALTKEKELYEKQNAVSDRQQLQRQLSLLRRAGGSATEIASLEQQLNSTLKDEYFQNQQDSIDSIKEANEKQTKELERQTELMQDTLDFQKENGVLWQQVYEVMKGDDQQIIDFMHGKAAATDFFEKSNLQQEDMLVDWAKKIGIYTEDRAREYRNYTSAQLLTDEYYSLMSDAFKGEFSLDSMKKAWNADNVTDRQRDAWLTHYSTAYDNAIAKGWSEEEAKKYAANEFYEHLGDVARGQTAAENARKETPNNTTKPSSGSGSGPSSNLDWDIKTGAMGVTIDERVRNKTKQQAIDYAKSKLISNIVATIKEFEDVEWYDEDGMYTGERRVKTYRVDNKVFTSLDAAKKYITNSINGLTINPTVVTYSTGGETGNQEGLAYLHKKERVLSAAQTESFNNLVDFITKNNPLIQFMKSLTGGAGIDGMFGNEIDNTVNIAPNAVVINVNSINDKYDIDDIAQDVMDKMVSIANKAGNRGVSRR